MAKSTAETVAFFLPQVRFSTKLVLFFTLDQLFHCKTFLLSFKDYQCDEFLLDDL